MVSVFLVIVKTRKKNNSKYTKKIAVKRRLKKWK